VKKDFPKRAFRVPLVGKGGEGGQGIEAGEN